MSIATAVPLNVSSRRAELRLVGDRGQFRAWLLERGYSPRTVHLYGQLVGRCATHLRAAGVTLGRARTEHLHDFWASVPPTHASRNGVRSALVAYYRYRGRKDGGPAAELPVVPKPDTLPRARSNEERLALISASRDFSVEHEALVGLLAFTGCRIGELEKARWHQFDLHSSAPAWVIIGKGARRKGPKERKIDLAASLLTVLLRWRVESRSPDWVFPSPTSRTGHRCQNTLRRMLDDVCAKAGIVRASPHVLRHTAASVALDRSRDIRALQELLGHASLATTQIYTKVLPGRLRALVETLEP